MPDSGQAPGFERNVIGFERSARLRREDDFLRDRMQMSGAGLAGAS